MSAFLAHIKARIGEDDRWAKVHAALDWSRIERVLMRNLDYSSDEAHGCSALVLFKCLLIGYWHNLDDAYLEDMLTVRLDYMAFCGFTSFGIIPDNKTLCRFWNALVSVGIYDDLIAEVERQLDEQGLKIIKGRRVSNDELPIIPINS